MVKAIVCLIALLLFINKGETTCTNPIPSNVPEFYYLSCGNDLPLNPATGFNSPTSINTFAYVTEVRGGTMANITNLIPEAAYVFTTCEPSGGVCPENGFDPIMVVRAPNGTLLGSNNDCTTFCPSCGPIGSKNSYVAYTHPEFADYSWVTVSVFVNVPGDPDCIDTLGRNRYLPLYVALVDQGVGSCNDYTLTCLNDTIDLGSNGDYTLEASSISSYADCGLTSTSNQTDFTCSDVGQVPVKVDLYDRTCTAYVTVVDNESPSLGSCGSTYVYYNYSDIIDNNCAPAKSCYVDIYSLFPPQLVIDENCGFDWYPLNSEFLFEPIGADYDYEILLVDPSDNRGEISCSYEVIAIHVTSVYDGDYFFTGNYYDFEVENSFPDTGYDYDYYLYILPVGYRTDEFGDLAVEITYEYFDGHTFYGAFFPNIEQLVEGTSFELFVKVANTNTGGVYYSIGNPTIFVVGYYFGEQ